MNQTTPGEGTWPIGPLCTRDMKPQDPSLTLTRVRVVERREDIEQTSWARICALHVQWWRTTTPERDAFSRSYAPVSLANGQCLDLLHSQSQVARHRTDTTVHGRQTATLPDWRITRVEKRCDRLLFRVLGVSLRSMGAGFCTRRFRAENIDKNPSSRLRATQEPPRDHKPRPLGQ